MPFKRLLIANRGEIACRVIKTAKRLGIHTIAVYSEADQNARHVREADESYYLGGAPSAQSYLSIEKIIDIAKKSGACAIHPGYGFLSENADFARACEKAGIRFVGPGVDALLVMGSKQLAKQTLQNSPVPMTPGYHGQEQSEAHLLAEAQKIGFPVLLKAAAGGGGKGMRAVMQAAHFAEELASAKREAKAGFGDDIMILEKLVVEPRHIEVQIMADNAGNVVHLFERDCSIQRRHQKIVEEAPAVNLPEALRSAITSAACEVARLIQYRGAGTVEFLLSPDGQFYFMEMNTRLQVEHPVTEMITGLDLVEWQLRIAAGENLPLAQEQIQKSGHAIELRICAESPENNFLPATGRIAAWSYPTPETGLRVDTGVDAEDEISPFYDSMIAKMIVHGDNREQAIQKLLQALDNTELVGLENNLAYLRQIISTEAFRRAKLSTSFLKNETLATVSPEDDDYCIAFAAAYYANIHAKFSDAVDIDSFAYRAFDSGCVRIALAKPFPCTLELFAKDHHAFTMRVLKNKEPIKQYDIRFTQQNRLLRLHLAKDRTITASVFHDERTGQTAITIIGLTQTISLENIRLSGNAGEQDGALQAPMFSTVVAVLTEAGQVVEQNQALVVLEAMKMEHIIKAPRAGKVTAVYCQPGEQVRQSTELVALSLDE